MEQIELLDGDGWKDSPLFSEKEKAEAIHKLARAKHWVENFAQERYIVKFAEEPQTAEAGPEITALLKGFAERIPELKTADEIQNAFYSTAKDAGEKPKELFRAAYLALIGKNYGPKIGTLILALGKERVQKRLKEL